MYTVGTQKHATRYLSYNKSLSVFCSSLSAELSSKHAIEILSYFLPHLKRVASLPREIQKMERSKFVTR